MEAVIANIHKVVADFTMEANRLKEIVLEKERKYQLIMRLRRRRALIHRITARRMTRGVCSTLYMELRGNPEKFFNCVRMKSENFDILAERVGDLIHSNDTYCRFSISPAERLMVTLRFLAIGESLSSLQFKFGLGIATISGIIKHTCRALWDCLHEEYIPHPTKESWLDIAENFQKICQFPNCLGALDGKCIRIVKPAASGAEYLNYKKYFSVVLMAIADAQYKFTAVDIGPYGLSSNGSREFKLSAMGRYLYGNRFQFPPPRPLPETSGPPMPFVCVGDEAFQLSEHLLKPYASSDLTPTKRVFNYRLKRARRMVECAFDILTSKWRVLLTTINLKTHTVDEVVKACVVLHNFLICKEQIAMDDNLVETSLYDYQDITFQSPVAVSRMRDTFAEYFISPQGRVEWQDEMV
ncbi:uncharacterized protein [Ranitomeya imitator]|uniref:uncharacterized protein n=1 Tax=Ranitomeya imitator TaxID=111125 RepID=UPI0037E87426